MQLTKISSFSVNTNYSCTYNNKNIFNYSYSPEISSRLNSDYFQPSKTNVIKFKGRKISFGSKELLQSSFYNNSKYLKYINEGEKNGSQLAVEINNIMNSSKREDFFAEITAYPKYSQSIVNILQEKLGGKENFLSWYFAKDGYVHNYEKYLKNKYEQHSTSIKDLIKLQPNWGYWALERKQAALNYYSSSADELMRDRKIDFNFGELPQGFGDKISFKYLIEKFKKLDFGVNNSYVSGYGNGHRAYIVTHLQGGDKSAKNIYHIRPIDSNTEYIVKMDRFYPEDKLIYESNPYYARTARETRLIKGDSVYLDACLDYYLQLNGVTANAQLLYYDFEKNAALYQYVRCNDTKPTIIPNLLDTISANRHFPEINRLGVFLNDIGSNINLYKDTSGAYRILDIGHAEYIDLLKPGAPLLTMESSNLCGFSLKNALAGLNAGMLSNINDKLIDIPTNNQISWADFMQKKNVIKEKLKNDLSNALSEYGEITTETNEARLKLIDFYKKNIEAREKGYGQYNYKTIYGILCAIERELNKLKYDNDYEKEAKEITKYIENKMQKIEGLK